MAYFRNMTLNLRHLKKDVLFSLLSLPHFEVLRILTKSVSIEVTSKRTKKEKKTVATRNTLRHLPTTNTFSNLNLFGNSNGYLHL